MPGGTAANTSTVSNTSAPSNTTAAAPPKVPANATWHVTFMGNLYTPANGSTAAYTTFTYAISVDAAPTGHPFDYWVLEASNCTDKDLVPDQKWSDFDNFTMNDLHVPGFKWDHEQEVNTSVVYKLKLKGDVGIVLHGRAVVKGNDDILRVDIAAPICKHADASKIVPTTNVTAPVSTNQTTAAPNAGAGSNGATAPVHVDSMAFDVSDDAFAREEAKQGITRLRTPKRNPDGAPAALNMDPTAKGQQGTTVLYLNGVPNPNCPCQGLPNTPCACANDGASSPAAPSATASPTDVEKLASSSTEFKRPGRVVRTGPYSLPDTPPSALIPTSQCGGNGKACAVRQPDTAVNKTDDLSVAINGVLRTDVAVSVHMVVAKLYALLFCCSWIVRLSR